MKTSLVLLATTLSFCFTSLKAIDKTPKTATYDAKSCLQITGIVTNDEDMQTCIVELISPNKAIDTVMLCNGEEKFEFMLKKNCDYLIRISKKGYLRKTVAVNTQILTLENEIHYFDFELSLIKETEITKLNKNLVNNPVALVNYNYQSESFEHNTEYSTFMKKELYNLQDNQFLTGKENSQPLSTKCHSFLALSR